MKTGLTEIVLVLDRSGSMAATRTDAEGGLRTFVDQQKKITVAKAVLTFYRFDNVIERVFDAKDIQEVEEAELSLDPRGSTALLDAMARAIDEVGERLSKTPEEERPEKVVFVTVTDGYENSSVKNTKQQVFDRITRQRDEYGWEFTFIGANQDAIASAADFGIPAQAALSNTNKGTAAAYAALTSNVTRARVTGQAICYSSEERNSAQS